MAIWPKYFIASEDPQPLPAVSDAPLRFAVDIFHAAFRSEPGHDQKPVKPGKGADKTEAAKASEWVVAADASGHLRLLSAARAQLPADLKRQLNTHELLTAPRTLMAQQIFLFDLEHSEAQGNPPGVNDPVSLHGRIFGPFPSDNPRWARGQLTVTRADVLDGLVRGWPNAFHYVEVHRPSGTEHRCLHLLLPGSAAPETERGEGAVLAFPMLGTALAGGDPANQTFAAAFLYDVLAQLQTDFLQENIRGAFPDLKLPVPSRRLHEARLKARGHEIHGDTVYAPISKPSRSWFGRLFQQMARPREKLPPEGTLADFLRLARVALQSLPGWPDGRALALQQLTRFHSITWRPGEDALMRPVPVNDREPHVAVFQLDETGVFSPPRPSRDYERFICLQVDPSFAFRRHADLDVQIEYQGGPGEVFVDRYLDLPEVKGCWSQGVRFDASSEWKTASISVPNTILDRRFWVDADLALVIRSKKDFRLRRVTLTGRGAPSALPVAPLPPIEARTPAVKIDRGGRGWLEVLNHWHLNKLMLFPRTPGFEVKFHGWVVDTGQQTTNGAPVLVLKSDGGEFVFPGRRLQRPDVVAHLDKNEAYADAGVDGAFRPENVPAGDYQAYLRLVRPDGKTCVEIQEPRRIRLYDEVPDSPAEPLRIESLGPFWAWGIDVHGFDPCFRAGACSGSGEVGFRIWLKKDRAYKLAVGLMEPEIQERDKRLFDLVVDGQTVGKYDLVAHPGTRRPHVVIVPAAKIGADGWIEVKVARHPDSKADHNVLMYGLWVFNESDAVSEDAIARGLHSGKALLYWPCGRANQRCYDEILPAALKHLEMKAGSGGLEIVWQGTTVTREGSGDSSIAAAFFAEQHPQLPAYGFGASVQPDRAQEFLQRLRSAPPYTLLALAVSGRLQPAYARELQDALRGWGIQARLPGEGGVPRRNLLAVGIKGLSQSFPLELDDAADLRFPVPPTAQPALVGHWKLDDGDRRILDSSGRRHHGTLQSGKWIHTPAGHVLEFDGRGYITIPYHADFDMPSDMTLMFWMRADELIDRDVLMAGRGDPWRPFLIWWRREHTVFTQCNRHGQGMVWVRGESGALRKWRHVAAVVQGHSAVLYIDGVEVARDSRRGVPATTNAPFTIGGFTNTWHPFFKGCMQDVRLYNYALPLDEILRIINEMPKARLISAAPKRSKRKNSKG